MDTVRQENEPRPPISTREHPRKHESASRPPLPHYTTLTDAVVLSYFVLLSWWFRSNLSIGREESVDGNDGARTRIIAQRGEKYLTDTYRRFGRRKKILFPCLSSAKMP